MAVLVSVTAEEALRAAADAFHRIVADHGARKLLGRAMPQPMFDSMIGKLLDPSQVEEIAADGFEMCARALAAMGASDVTIHECTARDLEIL